MSYNSLKILHIISATFLLTCMGYSYHLWRNIHTPKDNAERAQSIQTLTWLFIVPLAIVQLITGFTMISINHEDISQLWISGSIIGFITVICSWFTFIYFLLLSQQVEIEGFSTERAANYRRIQSMMLTVCALALLVMVFFMANKVA
ncbi:MAG: DUF2269 family protein [Pseudomonadota bacterium]